MMTKTSNTKKSSAMARVALGATAVLALAGRAHATCRAEEHVVVTGGVGACAACPTGMTATSAPDETADTATYCDAVIAGYYGTAGNAASAHATGVTKCPTGSTSVATSTTLAACTVSPGYYIQTASTTAPVMAKAPAGWYASGTQSVTSTAAISVALVEATGITDTGGVYAAANIIPCRKTFPNAIAGSVTSKAGSSASSDCVTVDGYYVSTADSATAANVVTRQVPANYYLEGGAPLTTASGNALVTLNACPYAGTSAAGSTSQVACTPDCSTTYPDSGAVAALGTCVCASGYYSAAGGAGKPYDVNSVEVLAAYDNCDKCSKIFLSAEAAGITTDIAATASTECKTAPGYYVSGTNSNDELITIAKAPENTWITGATDLTGANLQNPTQCPKNSVSAAGSSHISDCKCVAEYASTAASCEYCPGTAAGTAVGTQTTCAEGYVIKTSGASGVSVLAAISAVVAAQLVL